MINIILRHFTLIPLLLVGQRLPSLRHYRDAGCHYAGLSEGHTISIFLDYTLRYLRHYWLINIVIISRFHYHWHGYAIIACLFFFFFMSLC